MGSTGDAFDEEFIQGWAKIEITNMLKVEGVFV